MTDMVDDSFREELAWALDRFRKHRIAMVAEMQRIGDEIAAKATEQLDLPDGCRVVFEMEDL